MNKIFWINQDTESSLNSYTHTGDNLFLAQQVEIWHLESHFYRWVIWLLVLLSKSHAAPSPDSIKSLTYL